MSYRYLIYRRKVKERIENNPYHGPVYEPRYIYEDPELIKVVGSKKHASEILNISVYRLNECINKGWLDVDNTSSYHYALFKIVQEYR